MTHREALIEAGAVSLIAMFLLGAAAAAFLAFLLIEPGSADQFPFIHSFNG